MGGTGGPATPKPDGVFLVVATDSKGFFSRFSRERFGKVFVGEFFGSLPYYTQG